MRLGVSTVFAHETPEEWAAGLRKLGLGAAVFPVDYRAGEEQIEAYANAARKYDLVIAEVGAWKCNPASESEEEQNAALEYSAGQLRLADRLSARCCVNVTGAAGLVWDGAYRENFSEEHRVRVVASIQEIIDRARPKHTFYTVEPMPWMIPNSPEEYVRLMREVMRERFAVHMDLANWICTPERYFENQSFADRCFELLGPAIRSCHIKDVRLLQPFTFQLEETACGNGTLDLAHYARLAEAADPDMPVLIEHLADEKAYRESIAYVTGFMKKVGITLR